MVEACADVPVDYFTYDESSNFDSLFRGLRGESNLSHGKTLNILIIEAHDEFKQFPDMYTQNATVKSVIQGDKSIVGSEITMAGYFGVREANQKNNYVFMGTMDRNVLIPGNEYAVFCEKVEISEYLDRPAYRSIILTLTCFNLTSNYSKIIDPDNLSYSEYADSEFFAADEKTLEIINDVRKQIFEEFNIPFPDYMT